MASGKRASMREGPLAALFRKTEEGQQVAPADPPPAPPEAEAVIPDVDIAGILPTMVDTRTLHAKEAIEILEENFGDRVFATRIRKTIRFAEAPVKGTSVLKYDPEGVAAESYRELAKEVLANGRR